MYYNLHLYRIPRLAVPITDVVKMSMSVADISADPIIRPLLLNIPMYRIVHCKMWDIIWHCVLLITLYIRVVSTTQCYVYFILGLCDNLDKSIIEIKIDYCDKDNFIIMTIVNFWILLYTTPNIQIRYYTEQF